MSELAEFVEESVEPVVEVEEVAEVETPEVEAEIEPKPEVAEVEAVKEPEEEEGLPTEPDKNEEHGSVPIKALMAEREKRQSFERQVAELQGKISNQPPPVTEAAVMPTLESVDHDEAKYQEAMAKYYTGQVDSMLTQREQEREVVRAQTETNTRLSEFNTKGMALGEDYRVLVLENDLLPVTEVMRGAFLRADNGPEVLLQLAKGGQLERIAKMPKEEQSFEIGVLSERMKRTTENIPDPKPEAPKPEAPTSITSIRAEGGNTEVVSIPDPLETTFNR